jgi:uncharacterized protein (TIGR00297 family)
MFSQLFQGLIFALLIAVSSFRARFLTREGAIAQFFLGWVVLGLGGWGWAIPIIVFFLTSSMLSVVAKTRPNRSERVSAKGSTRDAAQVFANGGVAGLAVLGNYFFSGRFWYVAYIGSLAAAAADTWGTEIGTIFQRQTRLLHTLRIVEPGSSGGVSLPGTFGGTVGAIVVATSAVFWLPGEVKGTFVATAIAGVAGSLIDSLIGATIQSQFRCVSCGKITERNIHCHLSTVRERGILWVGNDLVNFFCTLSGALLAVVVMRSSP